MTDSIMINIFILLECLTLAPRAYRLERIKYCKNATDKNLMSNADQYSRGVLYAKKSEENYVLIREKPSENLARLIETFWLVTWDLSDRKPHIQQNIPDPCINMIFEAQNSRVVGAVTKRYSYELSGKGQIFGIKFRPGGFYSLTKSQVSRFTDSDIQISHFFGVESHRLIDRINSASSIESMVQISQDFLRPHIPTSVESVTNLNNIISEISRDSKIMRVSHLSEICNLSERSLQRLFKHQVGVSPKWVIRKCRIQEILFRLEQGDFNWQQLINQLDYFDQSHFIKDFKSLVGVTPTEYIKHLTKTR